MRSTTLTLLVTFASAALSASIPGLPTCAGNCLGNSFGSCTQLDVKCICSDTSLIQNLACCVSKACNAADQETTIKFADALCQGQGVSNLPTAATCAATASSTASGASSSSATGSMTTTPASLSSALASASAAASTGSMSNSKGVSAVSGTASSVNSAATSSAQAGISSVASSAASAASSAAAQATNDARVNGVGMGMVLAGLVAAL